MESFLPQVQLKEKFWVTEESKVKLLSAGAKCLDVVSHRERYYDTPSDELAMAGLWLSQRDQRWSLVVEPREERAADSDPETWEPLRQETIQQENPTVYNSLQRKETRALESCINPNALQQELTEDGAAKSNSTYSELVGESEIITYLATHFHVDLNKRGEAVTIEDFLERAGIQHYASKQIITQTTYTLSNKYHIVLQREESSGKEIATVSLDADVSNICKGFEEIEQLATYLRFERQAVQGEQKFIR